jgi:hypothetical protein
VADYVLVLEKRGEKQWHATATRGKRRSGNGFNTRDDAANWAVGEAAGQHTEKPVHHFAMLKRGEAAS